MTSSLTTRLYAITPPRFVLAEFIPQLEEAFAGGDIACVQLRLKEAADAEIIAAAKAIQPICAAHEAAFILNDRVDLVGQLKADGVHLGQEDLFEWGSAPNPTASPPHTCSEEEVASHSQKALEEIRKQLGKDAIIGVSCHASKHLAMEAGEGTADYVAFGAFYPTTTKPMEKLEKWGTPTTEILEWWAEMATIPSVAIGGITPQNLTPLVQAGADFVAVVTGIWNHSQGPKAAVTQYNQAIAAASPTSQKATA